MRKVVFGVLCVAVFAGCGEKQKTGSPTFKKGDYDGRIVEWVLEDYPDESLIHGSDSEDPTRGKFSSMVGVINQQKIEAAKHALDYGGCDKVESVLFDRRSSALDSLVYMVDCANGRRQSISSKDFGNKEELKSDAEKALPQEQAISQCKALIADKFRGQEVAYHDLIGMSYYKAPVTGNVRLVLDFDVNTGQKTVSKMKAQCFFEPAGKAELNISAR